MTLRNFSDSLPEGWLAFELSIMRRLQFRSVADPFAGEAATDAYLKRYYAIMGEEGAEQVAQSAAVDEGMATQYREAFAGVGVDELIYFPCSPDPAQVDLLADAVL